MKNRTPLFLVALLIATPVLEAGYRRVNSANPDDPMAVQIYRLDNGLTVYLSENHETPRFEAHMVVRAGSKHDPAESTGLAHYLEHMLFKGTASYGTLDYAKEKPHLDRITELYQQHFGETDPARRQAIYAEINKETQLASQYAIPNEMDKLYKSMGERGLNAHTWHEETVYNVNLPSNHFEQWAIIESERFLHPVFRLFQPELEIVYEEKNRSLDNKGRVIDEAVAKLLFKKHPYGQQSTIGEVEHLKNPSLKNMYEFYEKHYVPGNMAIVISGDIDPRDAIRIIDKHFSIWPAKPVPATPRWEEAPLQGVERVTVKYKGEEFVQLAFRTAGRNSPDSEALQLIDMILDNSTAGLINLNLNQQQKVRQAGSYPQLLNDSGAQYLYGIPKQGQTLKEVEDLLLEQVALIKSGQFEDWILPAIINDFKKNRKAMLESDSARVNMMNEAFLAFEDWDHAVGEIERMEKITRADVIRVANRYFSGGFVAGYRIDEQQEVPKIEKPKIDPISIDPTRQSGFARRVAGMKVKEIRPVWIQPGRDYKNVPFGKGHSLYYTRNPLNDLFALTILVEIGTRHDNRLDMAGALLDKSGTARLSAEDLAKEWYKLGTDFSVNTGENETYITIAGLDENFDASWKLLIEVLSTPKADPATLDELKQITLVQREDSKKDFNTLTAALFLYNRYGTNSPFIRDVPTAQLKAMTVPELHGLIQGLLSYRHRIEYTGSLPIDRVKATVESQPPPASAVKEPPPYRFLTLAQPASSRVMVFHKEMAQCNVRIEFADGTYDEASAPLVQMYNDYFSGGMSGIVFQELREARALAYSAGASYSSGGRKGEQNVVLGAIGCQADKTSEALGTFLDLFNTLPLSEERFQETRQAVLTQYRTSKLGFRQVLGAVRSWERLGVKIDPRRERFGKVQRVTLEQVADFQKSRLANRPRLISIVGDKSKFNPDDIKKHGDVLEIQLEELFVE